MSDSSIGKRSAQRGAAERRRRTGPGRVTRPGLLFLALLASACRTPAGSIPPGYRLAGGGKGVAIFSLENPEVRADERQSVSWTSEANGESVQLDAANDGPRADFHVLLPAGRYRMALAPGDSADLRFHLLHFTVTPGAVSYAGRIRFHQATMTARVVRVDDDYDAAVQRFRASHPELASEGVLKSLAEVRSCGSTGAQCDPATWSE